MSNTTGFKMKTVEILLDEMDEFVKLHSVADGMVLLMLAIQTDARFADLIRTPQWLEIGETIQDAWLYEPNDRKPLVVISLYQKLIRQVREYLGCYELNQKIKTGLYSLNVNPELIRSINWLVKTLDDTSPDSESYTSWVSELQALMTNSAYRRCMDKEGIRALIDEGAMLVNSGETHTAPGKEKLKGVVIKIHTKLKEAIQVFHTKHGLEEQPQAKSS